MLVLLTLDVLATTCAPVLSTSYTQYAGVIGVIASGIIDLGGAGVVNLGCAGSNVRGCGFVVGAADVVDVVDAALSTSEARALSMSEALGLSHVRVSSML